MKQIIREYLTYPARERNGVLVLTGIIALLLAGLGVSKYFVNKQKFDFTSFRKEVDAYNVQHQQYKEDAYVLNVHASVKHAPERFVFDPNTATAEDLEKLGLTAKQVHIVMSFRERGGFSRKEEFAKIKAIPAELYKSLEPYILIPAVHNAAKPNEIEKKIVSLNTADSTALVSIQGISPSLARNMLRFRNALGGFVNMQQLMEVRGITDAKFALLSSRTNIDSTEIVKININTCTVEQLSLHPYITYKVAKALINYRTVHGSFRRTEDVRSCDLVNEELYRKIAPYLTIHQ